MKYFIFLVLVLFFWVKSTKDYNAGIPKQKSTITFIMGEDYEERNQYYSLAKYHFENNALDKTDYLIDTCRSMWSVHQVLNNFPNVNYWETINIVVHSNPWTGFGASVLADDQRGCLETVNQAIDQKLFYPLPFTFIDACTDINFLACGMGANQELLYGIAKLFKNDIGEIPNVNSTDNFVYYGQDEFGQSFKSNLKPYYGFYRTGYYPGDIKMANRFKVVYPDEPLDWINALSRNRELTNTELFRYNFNVPLEWILTFNDISEIPDLDSDSAQKAMLASDLALKDQLNKLQIPIDNYRWQFYKTQYTFDDGTTFPAVKIKGKCTIVCILKHV